MNILSKMKEHHWDLAFVEFQGNGLLSGKWKFTWVKYSTRKRWFADPFILDISDKDITLLVEEFTYSRGKGRIAKVIIDRETMCIKEEKIILELPTHLSFPAIFRQGTDIYVYPENAESGKLNLYRYNPKNDKLEFAKEIIDAPLSDAVIVNGKDKTLILSTVKPRSNGNVLTVFISDTWHGGYTKKQDIIFGERIARNAGDVFDIEGMLVRPAQIYDRKFGYGAGLSIQQLVLSDEGVFAKELLRVSPPKGYDGMHTLNFFKDMAVVDCRQYNHPLIHSISSYIKHQIFKKINLK